MRRLGRFAYVPLAGFLVAVFLELVAIYLSESGSQLIAELITLVSFGALAASALYILFRWGLNSRNKWLGFLAATFLFLSRLMGFLAVSDFMGIASLQAYFVGRPALTHVITDCLMLFGLAALSVTVYLTLLESRVTWQRLSHERRRFTRQVSEHKRIENALRESEESYRLLFEATRDGIALLGVNYEFLLLNEQMARLTGYTREELLAICALDLVHPEDRERVAEKKRRRLQDDQAPRSHEFRILTKRGRELLIEGSFDIIRYADEVLGIQGVFRDITVRRQAEEALREREEHYRQLFEGISDAIFVIDSDHAILAFNEAAETQLGYTRVELQALRHEDICAPSGNGGCLRYLREVLEKGEARWECARRRKNGTAFPVDVSARRVQYQHRPTVMLISRDITQRKELEETLRAIAVGVSSGTGAGFFGDFVQHVSQALHTDLTLVGELSKDGAQIHTLAVWDHGALGNNFSYALANSPCAQAIERTVCCYSEGVQELFPLDTLLAQWDVQGYVGCALHHSLGGPIGVLAVLSHRPLTNAGNAESTLTIYAARASAELERARAEKALRESEERLRTLFEGIDDILIVHDLDGNILDCNSAACRRLDYSRAELLRMHTSNLDSPAFARPAEQRWERLLAEGALTWEGELARRDDSVFPVDIQSTLVEYQGQRAVLAVTRDITDRKRMEQDAERLQAQMVQAQKLESLGVLAGGIAHDFNNLLMTILGNANLAYLDTPPGSSARESLEDIEKAALRASDLAQQMLAYAGQGAFLLETVNLSELVEKIAHLLEVSIPKKTLLRYRFGANLAPVEADTTQLKQLLVNLVSNAGEAIGNSDGVITVATGSLLADRTYLRKAVLNDDLPEGRYVYIEVADTGRGMDPAVLKKAFDPFFSTKFLGRGLGLAAVMGIVRSLRGAILVASEPGRGTTVRILLPAVSMPAPALVPVRATASTSWRLEGKVLVVDDEEDVCKVTRRILERNGFEVMTARNGIEGLDLFRAHHGAISMVLLDIAMPLMSGAELLGEIRKIRENTLVIVTTGFSEQEATTHFHGLGLAGFLQKPFGADNLIQKIQSVMEGRPVN